ncbi:hypothetical protein QQX98_002169 [Neonectria punicea]|uniref:Xylanolytic transcriptional activator regulatory domain-containing protein n=1 Tax=Neonectria punicea TaxID=979145 RepID=A0ABR1HJU2_9HYPO
MARATFTLPYRKSKVKCRHDGQPPCAGCLKTQNTQNCTLSGPILSNKHLSSSRLRTLKRKRPAHEPETLKISRPEDVIGQVFSQIPRDQFIRAAGVFQSQFPELGFLHPSDLEYDADISALQMLGLLALLTVSSRYVEDPETSANSNHAHLVTTELHKRLLSPSLYLVQAFLILSLCNWGQGDGFNAWMHAGIASRMVQGLLGTKLSDIGKGTVSELESRTLWSCFAVDKLLSCGTRRPAMFNLHTMVHLPLNDADFAFGERNAQVLLPNESPRRSKYGLDDCFLLILKGLDIWSDIHSWTAEGGRRQPGMDETEECPWAESSQWSRMMRELLQWRSSQNIRLKYPETKVSSHAHLKQAEKFGYVNLIYYVCKLFLYREYIPFHPAGESKPRGPIEAPLLKAAGSEEFWKQNLTDLFYSATQISNLLRDLRRAGTSLRTPFSGLCAFSSALMNLYAASFPEYMGFTRDETAVAETQAEESMQDLREIGRLWKIAEDWIRVVDTAKGLFRRAISQSQGAMRMSRYDHSDLEESIHLAHLKGMPESATSSLKTGTTPTRHETDEQALDPGHSASPGVHPEVPSFNELMGEDEWRLWSFWDDPHMLPTFTDPGLEYEDVSKVMPSIS